MVFNSNYYDDEDQIDNSMKPLINSLSDKKKLKFNYFNHF